MRAALFLSAALLTTPAFAQVNDQLQLRDTTSITDVEVGSAYDVGATSVASGNVVTAVADDADAAFDNTQHMDGDTTARTDATVWNAGGTVAVTSAAVGNGGTAELRGSNVDINSTQLAHGDANASVNFTGGNAGHAATSASASGNVAAVSAQDSEVRFISNQESTGSTSAVIEADHGAVGGQVVSGAIASANNLTVGSETATVLTDTRQTATGDSVRASVDVYAGYATDVSGNATANANAVTIDNQWGYVNSRIDQSSTANVNADSYVTLGGEFAGFASSGAYGVGNQAIVSNVGSDTVMDVTQANGGDITANAAMSGEGGQMALASSAAYGNSVSGALCAYCDTNVPSLSASANQVNDGNVTSTATVHTPNATTVAATSTAIGNAGTYSVRGPGG
jgi:hypothetical protein